MAELTRRLQVLLDDERFSRLEDRARREGTSVAALVRDALDRAYPPRPLGAGEAVKRLLRRDPLDFAPWEQEKAELERNLERGLGP